MMYRLTITTSLAFVTAVAARSEYRFRFDFCFQRHEPLLRQIMTNNSDYDNDYYYINQPNTTDQEPEIYGDPLSWQFALMENVSYDSPYGNTTYDNGTSTEMPTQGPQPYGVYPYYQSLEYYYDHGSGQMPLYEAQR
ncbi:hypothetical protein KIN20_013043 [Parelaphostrongylus tenuis]|uniref:Uncharacterized protein n=1 Tax=Parelaphostrongylus tenuis TaxID=148309 RepID=A0AAD5QNI8_PARTN|nr:hypothetical protein KIN20_013043 [Parelaphostrongylus tenuis]